MVVGLNMAKYIDREALLQRLCDDDPSHMEDYYYNAIADTPTADVVEVKHGEWIYHECVSSYDGTISGHSCSVCKAFVHEETFDNDTFYKKYCGNCGARMDGKDREEAE